MVFEMLGDFITFKLNQKINYEFMKLKQIKFLSILFLSQF